MLPTNDYGIRKELKRTLRDSPYIDQNALVIDELGLHHGTARIDLAVIGAEIHGYELKSDVDNLLRLPTQAHVYNSVLDRVTLVVGRRHYEAAQAMIPEWWGITVVEIGEVGIFSLLFVRPPLPNPAVNLLSVAKLLWKNEALMLLEELNAIDGVRSKPRAVVYERLVNVADSLWLKHRVREQLRSRTGWRFVEPQKSCDD